MMSAPRSQNSYQVRFAYGEAGVRELEDADVVVLVDELEPSGDAVSLATAVSVAERVIAEQTARGERISVGVVARGREDVSFAVEDVLAAGAVVDALAQAGIDHCSPEAAAVAASFTGLRHATGHLISASVTARLLRESDAAS